MNEHHHPRRPAARSARSSQPGPLRPRRRAAEWTLALLACVAPLGLAGCGGVAPPADALLDAQLVRFDAAAPSYRLEGDGGSLFLGRGWEVPEGDGGGADPWQGYAWAQQGPSQVFFRRPAGSSHAFYAHCHPLGFEGAPVQSIRLRLNGRDVGEIQLAAGWQEVRHPLPAAALRDGINELELHFANAHRPSDVLGTGDQRRLSVAFSELAVVPADLPDPMTVIRAAEPVDGVLTMLPGTAVELPLPPRRQGRLRLPEMEGDCGSCTLSVSQVAPDGAELALWQGPAAAASGRELRVSTPEAGFAALRLSLSAPPGSGESLRFPWTPDLVSLRPRRTASRSSGNPGGPRPPHVFVYLVDTLRADALEPYGAPAGSSPRVAELARDAVVYTEARSASSWTLPAVVSLLTGEYARRHGMMNGKQRLAEEQQTLQQVLGGLGYRTLGVSQSYVAGPAFGVEQGFETFFLNNQLGGANLRSQRVRRYLTEWLLAQHGRDPMFAYLHTVDPHAPYEPPASYRQLADATPGKLEPQQYRPIVFLTQEVGKDPQEIAHLRALYTGEVAYADAQIGRFLDLLRYLGLYEESLIVVISDHGEEFGEHGGFDHGRTLYDELLRVPLIVKFPSGRWAGTRIDAPVSLVDLFPTVLVEAGAKPAGSGRPLQPDRLNGQENRSLFAEVAPSASEHLAAVDLRAIVRGRGKCIESRTGIDQFRRPLPPWQAFDLQKDPAEVAPLASDSELAYGCRVEMLRWEEEALRRGDQPNPEASQETLEELRALGYIR